ncbi:MAG: penicillin-binding protein activator LpoB [Planctomycetota bacterium]
MARVAASLLTILMASALLALPTGCTHLSRRVDPDVDDSLGGTGIDSADLRAITSKMARDLLEIPEIAQALQPPTVALEQVRNGTRFVIDTDIFLVRIRGLLNQQCRGKVRFLARQDLEAIMRERQAKREGVYSSSGKKSLLGADFFLTGELLSISKARDQNRSDYILYAFQLIDTENSLIVWEGQVDVKKVGKRGTLYR